MILRSTFVGEQPELIHYQQISQSMRAADPPQSWHCLKVHIAARLKRSGAQVVPESATLGECLHIVPEAS